MRLRRLACLGWAMCIMIPSTSGAQTIPNPGVCQLQTEYVPENPCCKPVGFNSTQSFTPQTSFRLQTVEFLLEGYTSSIGSPFCTVYLQDGLGAGATILASQTFERVLGPQWYNIDIEDVDVQAGQTYYLRIYMELAWWVGHGPDGYPNGIGYIEQAEWGGDYTFRICGQDLDGLCGREESSYAGRSDWNSGYLIGRVVQSFATTTPVRLHEIAVYLDADIPCTFTLYLQDGSFPTSNIYRQADGGATPGQGWHAVDLEDLDLVANKEYFIRMSGCNGSGQSLVWAMRDNSYPRGASYIDGVKSPQNDLYFRMCGSDQVVTGVETPTLNPTFMVRTSPNPAFAWTTVQFELPQPEPSLTVTVYDVRGRFVRQLAAGSYAAGRFQLGWNLRTDSGVPVGAGVYYVRLQTSAATVSKAIIVLR